MKVKAFLTEFPLWVNPFKLYRQQKEAEAEMIVLREKYPDLDRNRQKYKSAMYPMLFQYYLAIAVVFAPILIAQLVFDWSFF